jgi:hypothetical protein
MADAPIVINPIIVNHVLRNLPLFLNRDYLIDTLTQSVKSKGAIVDEDTATAQDDCWIYQGKFLDIDNQLYVISSFDGLVRSTGQKFSVKALGVPADQQLSSRNSRIMLPAGIVANYPEGEPIDTTMGRLLLNFVILAEPFGALVPYVNQLWNIGRIEEAYIFESLRTGAITVEQVKHYSRNLHHLGHFTELAVPSFSQRSLTPNPAIIARRNELLKQYKTEIEAGDPVVMSKIEEELIAMDKEYLKGDSSAPFYDYSASKSYNVARKAQYGLGGMVENFGEEGYSFIESSLEEGWKVEDFAIIANQIRSGSYSRAKETAKGGEETKFLIRVFQSVRVIEDDCGSQNYLQVMLSRDIASKFIYRTILVGDKLVTLTEENLPSYMGKMVLMRSPMHCHTDNGYCYTCMGETFRTINMELLTMAAINVSSSFTLGALKRMHGTKSKMISITSLNQFAV